MFYNVYNDGYYLFDTNKDTSNGIQYIRVDSCSNVNLTFASKKMSFRMMKLPEE